ALGWIVVMFAAGDLTSDGDLIIQGNWVGISTILLGAVAWAAGGYLWTTERGRRLWEPASSEEPEIPAAPAARVPGPARTRPKKSRSR
ncbi:MAG TPA: hypothetical protein VGJ28_17865, partial [Micromonosporaceae bacterium]